MFRFEEFELDPRRFELRRCGVPVHLERQVFAAQFLPDAPRQLWEAFNNLQRETTSTENVVRFLDAFARIDVSAVAPLVRCPTLILHSRHDERVPESQARELARLIPDGQLRLLNSGNHIPTAEEPAWPVLLEELESFLAAGALPAAAG